MRQGSRLTPAARVWTTLGLSALTILIPVSAMAVGRTETAGDTVTITLVQSVLIGLAYYLSQSPWILGLSFWTLYRPIVAGLIVGIILGDPAQGALIGAAINLVYLGFISAGGAIPGDPALAGYVGTTIAIAGGLDYGAALALAVPIGLLGTVIWNARMTVNAGFVHMADKAADEADIAGVIRASILWPQLWLFLITAVPVSIAVYLGTGFIADLINSFPVWILNGLAIAGGVLPAIGIAMNMKFIFRGSAMPYFFIGYLAMVVLGSSMSIMLLAGLGLCAAILHVALLGDRIQGAAARVAARKSSAPVNEGSAP